jgi:hypothetical protein
MIRADIAVGLRHHLKEKFPDGVWQVRTYRDEASELVKDNVVYSAEYAVRIYIDPTEVVITDWAIAGIARFRYDELELVALIDEVVASRSPPPWKK